ncbi:sn-glycerol-1-phosphate dehydrogenase [Paenibacillus validus]|uniref:sn-glycerol-1-phosphate dehydrogenase n=2 Tax=Paenibacillus validus TaxID=44253 RepID=UPI000FD8F399|nr:sn-glycerol-1-phosphate dehydrogenase [Paenibacillus validus]
MQELEPSQVRSISSLAAGCPCCKHHPLTLDRIVVERGALLEAAPYLKERGYRQVALVSDENTYRAAGGRLASELAAAGTRTVLAGAKPDAQGDVVADEAGLIRLMLDIPQEGTDALLAVGSGTLHDMVRFIAFKMGKPFISVPTAPSVDGFTSVGAPLIFGGEKITIPAIAPDAIFADLDVLIEAPQPLVAAGFGDMLGKYTSLFDWRFGHLVRDEPYCPAAAQITKQALLACVRNAEAIAERSTEGLRILMNALIESGLAMQLFGQSHPASGAEHHLSHYWEMEYLRLGRKQLLHGAKVGVACAVIAQTYHRLAADESFDKLAAGHGEELRRGVREIPTADELKRLLLQAGGPETADQLGIDDELLSRSLREAPRVRPNRFTLLHAVHASEQSSCRL